ncbi:mitochondrial substrate carrier family protein [Cavenderia fasciculata]|uniref:Mitochondrial substrate carrier family protein n=1 Tax=Cavenderia fasciculata TaxID=261658 RepID=F4PKX4_CACFS|nr:mitochondrial substrate carrier family protein [Cavenderia fasciculata]EGG23196.1 mitochondrial substrate carrier family protein [Cavenderia fasciculata]|eukprot:XP_004361047.1 mitochondrial substrate carrier family protein [Cavenderia fasciculata]
MNHQQENIPNNTISHTNYNNKKEKLKSFLLDYSNNQLPQLSPSSSFLLKSNNNNIINSFSSSFADTLQFQQHQLQEHQNNHNHNHYHSESKNYNVSDIIQQEEKKNQTQSSSSSLIVEHNKMSNPLLSFDNLNSLISGSVAGALSRTSTAGFERLTIIQQVQGTCINAKYNGCFNALKNMVKNEGFRSLFKGNGANIVKVSPNSGIRFLTYDCCKNIFTGNDPSRKLGRMETVASGAMAGLTSTVFTYPIDLIRIRLSLQGSGNDSFSLANTRYSGIRHGLQTIHAEEGVRGLYRGLGTAIMSVAPWVSLSFLSYEGFKSIVKNNDNINSLIYNNNNNVNNNVNNINNNNNNVNNNSNQEKSKGMVVDLLCGAASGAFTMTVCYPLDVLRRRMMVQGIGGDRVIYKNGLDALRSIYKTEGIAAFYKGIKPAYLKVVPTVAISFAAYELCKELLDTQYRNTNDDDDCCQQQH